MSSAPSRSSDDLLARALERAVGTLAAAVTATATTNPVVLIDGRSGAGKTSLARRLVSAWPQHGRVQLVSLDSVYPGWDGLADGVEYARESILVPHGRGLIGVWQRWDWEAAARAEAHAVDPSLPLIVEGAGALTSATARLADVRVWVEAPGASRKSRAIGRDGDLFRPHWSRWAGQEEEHLARNAPSSHATHVIALP